MTDWSSWSSLLGSVIVAAVAFYAIRANNSQAARRDRDDWYRKTLVEHAGPFLAEVNMVQWQLADSYEHHPDSGVSDTEINFRASESLDAAIAKVNGAATLLRLSCSRDTKKNIDYALAILKRASAALKQQHGYSNYADEPDDPKHELFLKALSAFERAEQDFIQVKEEMIQQIEIDLNEGTERSRPSGPSLSSTFMAFASRNLPRTGE